MAQQEEKPRPKTGQQNPQNPGKNRQGGQGGPGQSGQRGQQGHTGQQHGDNPRTREEENEGKEDEEE